MVTVVKVLVLAALPVGLLTATGGAAVTAPVGDLPKVEAQAPTSEVAYRAPVPGAVTRLFEAPLLDWGAGHRGVDLQASVGQSVDAPAAGRVLFAGTVVDRGVVTVLHPDGLRSSLEPVDPGVTVGDEVTAGDVLGTLQDRATHTGVHWGVRDADGYLDPLDLLAQAVPVVLLPPGGRP